MILELAHGPGIRRLDVVHSDQVKQTVDDQVSELVLKTHPSHARLPLPGLHRDDDVPERVPTEARTRSLEHGECEDVGGAGRPPEAARKLGDCPIVDEGYGDLSVKEAQDA